MSEDPTAAAGDTLPPELAEAIRARFKRGEACKHCGGIHSRACPRVRRMVFQGENIVEVEFWPAGRWPDDHIIWPEDVSLDDDPPQTPSS